MERLTSHLSEIWYKLARKRPIGANNMDTPLNRCLTTFDITLLGVGHMVGAGIYVLTGSVTRYIAGPAIVVSFMIAGAVSFLSALCFAEFASRVPRAGSTYVYTYITMGEFWAFLVGWNMILDQLVGAASVARAWSGYVDALAHGAIHNATVAMSGDPDHAQWTGHLDFLAAGVIIVFALLQAIGVRGSTNINSLFSLVNVAVMVFVSTYGFSFADVSNWDDFTPYGAAGVMSGATSCFFAYVGLDSMAVAAEEAKDPGYSVPRATFYAMGIVTIGYLLVSTALTLMIPYQMINVNAALAHAFAYNGAEWAQYLVSVAALAGMSSVLFGHMYTVPRYVYSMATDGLVFRVLSRVNKRTQVPVLNTFALGVLASLMALVLDIQSLVEFMAMGTLIGYSMVAMAVLMLRYRPTLLNPDGTEMTDCTGGELKQSCHFLEPFIVRLPYAAVPTSAIYVFTLFSFMLSYLIAHAEDASSVVVVFVLLLFATMLLCCFLALLAFEQTEPRTFAVPFCPVVPLLSIGFNMMLLSYLRPGTWLRFLIWMLAGLLIYFCYGIRHSTADEAWKKRPLAEQEQVPQWYGAAANGDGRPQPSGPPPSWSQSAPLQLDRPPRPPADTEHGRQVTGAPAGHSRADGSPPVTGSPAGHSRADGSPQVTGSPAGHSRADGSPQVTGSPAGHSRADGSPQVTGSPAGHSRADGSPQVTGSPTGHSRADSSPPTGDSSPEQYRLGLEGQWGADETAGTTGRPGLQRQSQADTESLPSLTHDQAYRLY